MQDFDGLVGIYSSETSLTQRLVEKFKLKYLDVLISESFSQINFDDLNYLIINLLENKYNHERIVELLRKVNCKVIIIYPLYVEEKEKFIVDANINDYLKTNKNLGVMLVPDLLGKDVEYQKNALSHELIMQSLLSERVKISEDSQPINAVTLSKLAERIIKDTLSFGISGQILSLIGPRITCKSFVVKYLGVDKNNVLFQKSKTNRAEVHSTTSASIEFSLSLAVKNTIRILQEKSEAIVSESLVPVSDAIKDEGFVNDKVKFNFKPIYLFVSSVFVFLMIPLLLITVSVISLFLSYRYLFDNRQFSENALSVSLSTSNMARNISLGNNFIYDNSNIVNKTSTIVSEGLSMSKNLNIFFKNIISDEVYDLNNISNNISASLDKIHTDISFLQSDVNDLGGFTGNILKNKLFEKNIDLGEYKEDLFLTKNLFSRISYLLGQNSPKKYLILFQNNMELRPTGGFIGSFGLFTFDKGKLTDININDVYEADGQLKGHVDPPEPIREYLGEGGWYLRDSNWNPSFPDSSEKIEWFLDKETGEKVDGVIAIDLHFIKKILSVTGPIKLNDFDKVVNESNLYSLIQSEVESNFFPGSTKKATILTSLSKSIINEIENLKDKNYLSLLKATIESLEQKHILIYLHDENAQASISKLGYSGEYKLDPECGVRCIKDGYSLIDANLGVNKSNFYVKRSQNLNVTVSKTFIGHELVVNYENTANQGIGNSGIYESYSRILLPINSNVGGVRLYEADGSYKDLEYDLVDTNGRREVGFVVEVLPSTNKAVQIVWNYDSDMLASGGEYNLIVMKQPGTEADNLQVNVNSSDLSLTGRKVSKYNTNLGSDFRAKLFYK